MNGACAPAVCDTSDTLASVAAHFEAERKACHRAVAAVIDPAGFRLLGAPGIGVRTPTSEAA